MRRRLDERVDAIAGSGNLFASPDDVKLLKSARNILAKKLRSLELRVKSLSAV